MPHVRQPEQQPTHGNDPPQQRARSGPHPVEWIVAAASGVLVVLLIAVILYQAVNGTDKPPELLAKVERIEPTAGGHRVSFVAINQGDSTVAATKIEGSLKEGDRTLETADVTLDYVPAHSQRRGALLFENDPSEARLQISAKGHVAP